MAVIFDQIVGHADLAAHLRRAFQKEGRTAHALLFSGPSGVGKKLVARAWAQGILCPEPNPPCGKCSACLRVERGQHPDLLVVAPGDSPTIKIDQIREIQNFISLKAFEDHAKIVIIDEAQTMTSQSANALLKTLEEPPAGSFFVLVTSNSGALPTTILSRCQKVLFGSLTVEQVRKLSPGHAEWIYGLAHGRVDVVNKLADENYAALRLAALKALRSMAQAGTYEGFMAVAPLVEDRDSALFAAQCLGQWLKNAAATKLGVNIEGPAEEKSALEHVMKHFSADGLLRLGQKIIQLESDIQANINKNLAFEKFWMDAQRLRNTPTEDPKLGK